MTDRQLIDVAGVFCPRKVALVTAFMIAGFAARSLAEVVLLDAVSQGGAVCADSYRPINTAGAPASFWLTARTGIDSGSPTDPNASGSLGVVAVTVDDTGVQMDGCSGSFGISGTSVESNEELVFHFDGIVSASTIILGLNKIDFATLDDPVIFISSVASTSFDYTILGAEIEAAFIPTGTEQGEVHFSLFASLPTGLGIDKISIRETGGHFGVESATVLAPAANLDQVRNGSAASPISPGNWVNGNAGSQNAHYVEGFSAAYRVVMTDLPTGTDIILDLGYDIKHSNAHALDYLTHYDRLEPHSPFGHAAETIDPTIGVAGVTLGSAPDTTFPILAPSSTTPCASPVSGMPTSSFNALPLAETVMSLWNGTLSGFSYVSEGCLTDPQAETIIRVTFQATSSTAVLSWGGHIGLGTEWDPSATAGGITGSPYHMRLKDWNLTNLGNQDRSLSAASIQGACDNVNCSLQDTQCQTFACDPAGDPDNCDIVTDIVTCPADTLCETFACNPGTGVCDATPIVTCPADTACETFACNTTTGVCDVTPIVTCPADTNCETFACNPTTGICDATPTVDCSLQDDACQTFACDPATGAVGNCDIVTDIVTCPADTACETFACNTTTGVCDVTPIVTCPADTNCETFACNPTTGICDATPTVDCSLQDDACQTFACDPATGAVGNCDTVTDISTDCTPLDTQCETFACDPAGATAGNCEAVTDITTDCTPLNTSCDTFACDPSGTTPGNCETITTIVDAIDDDGCCPPGFTTLSDNDCVSIPTVSQWGMLTLSLLLVAGLSIKFGRRHGVANG